MRRHPRGRLALLLLMLVCLGAGCDSAPPTARSGTSSGPPGTTRESTRTVSQPPPVRLPFAPTSFWNKPIPEDALPDEDSATLVAALGEQVSTFGPYMNTSEFSSPVYTVGRRARVSRVVLDRFNPPMRAAFSAVPLPAHPKPAAGSDAQLIVWQPSTDTMWEFFKLHRVGGAWHARWGGRMRHVSENPGYFTKPHRDWGASGTSLPLLGGLIRPAELRAGDIRHALALIVPHVKRGVVVHPAQRSDGDYTTPDAIPEGTRFRLDPALDIASLDLPPFVATIARAVQTYGMVVRDQSGAVAFEAEDPSRFQHDVYRLHLEGHTTGELLRRFPWDRLQVVSVPRP